jgi:hypothetical protein
MAIISLDVHFFKKAAFIPLLRTRMASGLAYESAIFTTEARRHGGKRDVYHRGMEKAGLWAEILGSKAFTTKDTKEYEVDSVLVLLSAAGSFVPRLHLHSGPPAMRVVCDISRSRL